jgi:hypothetical protein
MKRRPRQTRSAAAAAKKLPAGWPTNNAAPWNAELKKNASQPNVAARKQRVKPKSARPPLVNGRKTMRQNASAQQNLPGFRSRRNRKLFAESA